MEIKTEPDYQEQNRLPVSRKYMSAKNCWEFKNCGREPGGANVDDLGACPAATEIRTDGVNGGKNGGRTCWAICGTMCGGIVLGTYAAKISDCRSCEFYQSVQRDLQTRDQFPPNEHPSKVLTLVLERTAALEREIERRMQVEKTLCQTIKNLTMLSSITRHDIRNKLMVLQGYNQLAEKLVTDEKVRNYLRMQNKAAEAIGHQIEFTKDYENLGMNTPVWQQLHHVLAGVQDLAYSVPIEVDPGLGKYEIYADPLLSRVYYNLADNAIRHGERVSRIQVHGVLLTEGLVIVWEDDGVGVPQTEKEKIFNKGHGKNTGLGLFLVREILSITGITIRETGIDGKGARFEIVVPEGLYRLVGPS